MKTIILILICLSGFTASAQRFFPAKQYISGPSGGKPVVVVAVGADASTSIAFTNNTGSTIITTVLNPNAQLTSCADILGNNYISLIQTNDGGYYSSIFYCTNSIGGSNYVTMSGASVGTYKLSTCVTVVSNAVGIDSYNVGFIDHPSTLTATITNSVTSLLISTVSISSYSSLDIFIIDSNNADYQFRLGSVNNTWNGVAWWTNTYSPAIHTMNGPYVDSPFTYSIIAVK